MLIIFFFQFAELGDQCERPDNSKGVCTLMKECPSIIARFNEDKSPATINYIRSVACPNVSLVGGRRSVCCTDVYESCVDPHSNDGLCVPIYKCEDIKNKTQPPISEETKKFLRQSQCDFKYKVPWVCCSSNFDSGSRNGGENVIVEPLVVNNAQSHSTDSNSKNDKNIRTSVIVDPPEVSHAPSALDELIKEKIEENLIYKAPRCGQDSADRIYGGNATALDEFPWLALIGYDKGN